MGLALSQMKVTSTAFEHNGKIPARHTGEGEDVSPPLAWQTVPDGTRSFAVICHDPDAPVVKSTSYGFVHWVLYDLPASTTTLQEGTGQGTQGVNDFGKAGYGGPMPPEGHGVHHYYFLVLALDRGPGLEPGLTLDGLLEKIEPHVLGMNRLIGTYMRG
ncbi:MAG: YbhB/YbcL family Raf kinase inhibitor-like protein [Chloroflexota bacterium]